MHAESIKLEWDEHGCYMHLTLEDAEPIEVWLSDPEQAYDAVRAAIEPWLMERNAAKAEYDRMKRAGDTRLMDDQQFTEYLDDAYGDDWSKRVGMEQMRESGHA